MSQPAPPEKSAVEASIEASAMPRFGSTAPVQRRALHWTQGPRGVLFLLAVDAVAIFDAFALAYLCRFHWGFVVPALTPAPSLYEYTKAWVLGGYVILGLFHAYGLYDRRCPRDAWQPLLPIVKAGLFAVLFILALGYFYRGFSYSRLSVLYAGGFGMALVGGFRVIWERYRFWVRQQSGRAVPAVLVGSREIPRMLASRIAEDSRLGYRIEAVVDDEDIPVDAFAGIPRGRLEDLPALVDQTGAREVLIGHPAVGHHQLLALIECCERRGVLLRMIPATYDLLIDSSDFEEIAGVPLVTINESRSRPGFRVAKRIFDLVVGGVLATLALPVMACVALAIRRDGKGPVLFRQTRVGRCGQEFRIIKFRTMIPKAEEQLAGLVDLDGLEEPVFKLADDPRVTPVGRLLRRWSLDELPQLFNVLGGSMSLVGPRPEQADVVERYDIWERRRIKLKPGITGLQQIHCRGSRSLKERVRWDILYLRRESLALDLGILLRTVGTVLGGRGAT